MVDAFDALLGLAQEAEGTASASYLSSSAGLGQVIRAGDAAGLSGRSILASWRDAGGHVTDANYWQLRNAVLSGTSPPFGHDFGALLSGEAVTEIPGGREGLYQVNFRQYVQHSTPGLPDYSVQNFSMSQRELDVADAARAMSDMMDSWDNPADAYGRLIGFEITSVVRYTG